MPFERENFNAAVHSVFTLTIASLIGLIQIKPLVDTDTHIILPIFLIALLTYGFGTIFQAWNSFNSITSKVGLFALGLAVVALVLMVLPILGWIILILWASLLTKVV